MGLLLAPDDPLFTGPPAIGADLGAYHVALAGRAFMLDLESDAFRHKTIPLMRDQQDTSEEPGEQSLSREGVWRRTQSTWHKGAGQTFFDREGSDPARFRSSKGIDPWTKWQLSLLPDTALKRTSTATNLSLLSVGTYLYVSDGTEMYWTQDITVAAPTWTAVGIAAGEVASTVQSLATDGYTVYAALGAIGVHTTTRGATTSTHFSDLQAQLVAYVKGRLMAARDNAIYNVTAGGVAPAPRFTHPNTDFRWVGFAGSDASGHIFAAGYSGDTSLIYSIGITDTATELGPPTVRGQLDGEIIRSIFSYGDLLFIGTDDGVRFARADASGNLTIGARIPVNKPVRAFEQHRNFFWFGWENYDATSTGLGRLDPTTLNATTPAYASDLMATAQGSVTSIATFQDRRVFAVSGSGIWVQADTKVASGTLDTGLIGYGLGDTKIALYLDVRHENLVGSHSAYLAADGGAFVRLGTHSGPHESGESAQFPAGQVKGEALEIRHELTRSTTDPTSGPTVSRHTLKSSPVIPGAASFKIAAPLLLSESLLVGGVPIPRDVGEDLAFLFGLRAEQDIVLWQERRNSYSVVVEDIEWAPHKLAQWDEDFSGTAVVVMRSVA